MLIKNQIYEATVTDYTAEGQGIAHVEGCAVFLPNAVAGERVRLRIEHPRKTWAAGKIVEILEKSPHRVNRECPVAKLCGGCDFWHMDYEEETRLKAERVKTCLNRLGGENLTEVPILAAPTCYGYRNKAQYPVSSKKGRAYAGFFRAGTHDVVENQRCLILPEQTDNVKDTVMDYVNQYRVPAYDETTHTGLLRHIYVRRGAVSGQILVCLVCNGEKLPKVDALIARLEKIPGFTTLVLSVNTKKGNAVLGDKFITLCGPGYIEDTLCGLNFRLSPRSFYQVNHHQAQRLYEAAISQAEITKNDTVLDLYCGVGTITLAMAGAAGKVIGVEVIPQAVEDARDNAKRNGIENAEFFCGDAGAAALELEKNGVKPDVVVVDPPRKGLNADTIEALHRMAPRRIVYVSCDPATLARDVALLKDQGYTLATATAADLFPRCSHVESIVCLRREKVDGYINLTLNVEELGNISHTPVVSKVSETKQKPIIAERKTFGVATYPQIKDYIWEKYGLKVPSAYIAQVKEECGIKERKNYYIGKEGHKVPNCTPEKREAILDAFKRDRRKFCVIDKV